MYVINKAVLAAIASPPLNEEIIMGGYYSAGDGGGGTFIWVPGAGGLTDGGVNIPHNTLAGYFKRLYEDPINVRWFGTVGDGVVDDTVAFQKAIDYCISNPARPKTLYIPIARGGRYLLTQDLVINVRNTSVQFNPAKFSIIGEQGKGGNQGQTVGVTLYRTGGPGSIIRICEEADGSYPGGGKETVVDPFNFLRSIEVRGINFVGKDTAVGYSVNGISGRSIDNSVIENCGFAWLNYGIKFGTGLENVANEQTTIGNLDLDYCERNLIQRCAFGLTKKHIYITAPDITTITQNFFHNNVDTSGDNYVLYWAAGNDYLTFTKNIVHPRLTNNTKIDRAIRCYATRGALFAENHFEDTGNKLFDLAIVEDIEIRNNSIKGILTTVQNVINISAKEQARVNVHDNIIAHPAVTDVFLKVVAVADDGSNTKLKTVNVNYRPNKATTELGGNVPLILTSNLDALYIENGQAFNPQRIGRNYVFSDNLGNLRTKLVASGKPTLNTDGLILWSEGYTTFDQGGTTITKQRHIKHPIGGHYTSPLADQTGCIVLKHSFIESSLLNADIRIQMYNSSVLQTQRNIRGNVEINLTAYLTAGAFSTLGASIKGDGSLFQNQIRVAKDAEGDLAIIIGDVGTVWNLSYVRAWIENLSVGLSGSGNNWDTGWTSSIETNLTGYTELTDLQPKLQTGRYQSAANNVGFASVPANSQIAYGFSITVTGAAVGDFAIVTPSTSNGLIFSAVVTTPNLVMLYATNPTAATIAPPTISMKIAVFK